MSRFFLHPDDVEYFERLCKLGFELAAANGIEVSEIKPKRPGGSSTGRAYLAERRISIEVRDKDPEWWGTGWHAARYPHLENLHTLAHELAHLKQYQETGATSHNDAFKQVAFDLYEQLKAKTKGPQ